MPFEPGYPLPGSPAATFTTEELLRRAQEAAAGRVVLRFLGRHAADESEGYDRQHLLLPTDHMDLLHAVRRVANKVIVLLSNGAAVETTPWQTDADAIMELWLPGQAGGEAVARLVTGEDSPSGRLAETIPEKLEQHPAQLNFPGEAGEVRYEEGFSLDIAGFRNSGTDRVTPSAMAWPALPSSSPICGQKHPRSPPKQGWMRWFSPFRSPSPTPAANAVLRSPSFISGIWSPR